MATQKSRAQLQAAAASAYPTQTSKSVTASDFKTQQEDIAESCAVLSSDNSFTGKISFGNRDQVIITDDAIQITGNFHRVRSETDGVADNLETINGGLTGQVLVLVLDGTGNVTLKEDDDNLRLAGDFVLDTADDTIVLLYNGSNWLELMRSTN